MIKEKKRGKNILLNQKLLRKSKIKNNKKLINWQFSKEIRNEKRKFLRKNH